MLSIVNIAAAPRFLVIAICLSIVFSITKTAHAEGDTLRPFTVEDSISMRYPLQFFSNGETANLH